jgi:MFS family permease
MKKPFWLACFTHMFLELFLLIQVALIPVFVQEFQLSLLEASLAVTIPMIVQLLMNIPSGMLADRFKTRHLLFASMVIEGSSALFLSQTSSFWMLIMGVSVMRLSSPIYHISGLSRISRLVKYDQLSRSMGFHNALGSFGSAIGTISLAVFLPTLGWRYTYLFWSFPVLAWGFFVLRSSQLDSVISENKEVSRTGAISKLSTIFSVGFPTFLVAIGFRAVGVVGANTFVPTYLVQERKLSEAMASLIFGLGPFMGIVGSLAGGYLGERMGAKKILSFAILGCVISLFVFAFLTNIYLLVPVYLAFSFFNNTVWSPMNTLVVDITPPTERGLSFSMYFLTEGLIEAISPTIAVKVIELSGMMFLFLFSVILGLVSIIILQALRYPRATSDEAKVS